MFAREGAKILAKMDVLRAVQTHVLMPAGTLAVEVAVAHVRGHATLYAPDVHISASKDFICFV